MSTTADEERVGPAARLGIEVAQVVLEVGWDEDADEDLRQAVEDLIGSALENEDYDDVADVVLLWFREDDGDLTDAIVDVAGYLVEGGFVLLLTPKTGRDGYVEPGDIADAARTAGLALSKSVSAAPDWNASRLVSQKR